MESTTVNKIEEHQKMCTAASIEFLEATFTLQRIAETRKMFAKKLLSIPEGSIESKELKIEYERLNWEIRRVLGL